MKNNNLPTATILYFSGIGFFRQKSEEKQRVIFAQAVKHWQNEFNESLPLDIYDQLIAYQKEQQSRRKLAKDKKLQLELSKPIAIGTIAADSHVSKYPAGKYVLTSAQNNTLINKDFFNALLQFCKHHNAKLLIAKITYNKNGFLQPESQDNELWYANELKPYLIDSHIRLGENFEFIGNSNVSPTAKNPLTGFSGISPAGINAIIPATKVALKVSAALKNGHKKILMSTGTVTLKNYIYRKVGTIAAIEHNFAAVFIDTNQNVMRHVELMENCKYFYDLDYIYLPDGYTKTHKHVAALHIGDVHAEKVEKENFNKLLDLLDFFKPDNILIHDLIDFSSRNHHNKKDCRFIHLQHVKGNTVESDLQKMSDFLDTIAKKSRASIHVIESNHDLAINTWLQDSDFKLDPVNARIYLKLMLALYEHQENYGSSDFNMLKYCYNLFSMYPEANEEKVIFHSIDDSVKIAGIEFGNHGHIGANGARGNINTFRELGEPINIGHSHTPAIQGKAFSAGVLASLNLNYNKGLSNWAIAHVVCYENSQRQIIFA